MSKKVFSVRLEEEQIDIVFSLLHGTSTSISEFVRDAIDGSIMSHMDMYSDNVNDELKSEIDMYLHNLEDKK